MALSPDTTQTLAIMWVFTWVAMALMALRLAMRKVRGQKFDASDKLTMLCMFFLVGRCAIIHVVLMWGSNNVTQTFRKHHVFSANEIYRREVGSKLTLVNRTFYNSYIWLQKCVVMCLYRRILFGLPWTDVVMNIYWGILAATYIVIQVVTFTDCRPLHLYWQVVPDPGTCSEALGQLIILGALNIFTDILLIILPMPALLRIRRSVWAKLRLFALFSLGAFLVIITVIRLPINFSHGFQQVNRTTWASTEALTAAIVANIPTLYTLRKRSPAPDTSVPTNAGSGSKKRRLGWSQMDAEHSEGTKVGEEGIMITQSVELKETNMSVTNLNAEIEGRSWDKRARDMQDAYRDRRRNKGSSEEDLVGF